jgi:hypothetical protein
VIEEPVARTRKPVLTRLGGQGYPLGRLPLLTCKSAGREHQVKHPPKKLPLRSEHRLNAYAAAATAAGVGAVCLGQSAEAKVVYTPANVKIVQNVGWVRFDLNHDGISDFGLSNYFLNTSERAGVLRVAASRQANEIWVAYSQQNSYCASRFCAAALPKGTKIGPKGKFQVDPYGLIMACSSFRYVFGPWLHVKQAYLGLKFVVKGKPHFGWARVKLSVAHQSIAATLTGYAHETIPGKPIIAGATNGPGEKAGSLGALAGGVAGR